MTFEQLLELALDNLLYTIIILVVGLFFLYRSFKTMQMYLGAKSFVRNAQKLDKKKFNGLQLVDQIKRKRKKDTNNFNKLRQRAKNKVRRYFEHKLEELPVVVRYKYGKLLKRNKKQVIILIKNERKTLQKITYKKGMKNLIEATNKHECLDEMIIFLHQLPDAILEEQDCEILANYEQITITYTIK